MTGPLDALIHRQAIAIEQFRYVIGVAVAELDAVHRPDEGVAWCVTCGAADGSWPCVSRQVADDLLAALNPPTSEETP